MGGSLTLAIEPSMFRHRSSEVARYGTWPVVAQPLHHAAWPLFLNKDIERARGWLEDAKVEVSIGPTPGEIPLEIKIETQSFEEIFGSGGKALIPKKVGVVKIPPGQKDLFLWIRFSGMFHPRVIPRMFFYPEGFVTGHWTVEVDTSQSDLGCSIMPLGDRAQFKVRRNPNSTTVRRGWIEILPPEGSLLLPTDGVLVSFFPPDAI